MANDKDTTFGGAGVANARATVKGFVKRESVRIADLGGSGSMQMIEARRNRAAEVMPALDVTCPSATMAKA